jgi:hypothetical protein
MKSETIGKLADALAKAQRVMGVAKKDSTNPFFKSKYADLSSVIDAIREPLASNGLSYVQYPERLEGTLVYTTLLMHSSGEWISGSVPMLIAKQDMQGQSSAITYAARYGLSRMAGIAQDDDDGNGAAARGKVFPMQPEITDGVICSNEDYVIPGGKYNKRHLHEIDPADLMKYIAYIEGQIKKFPEKPEAPWWADFVARAEGWLGDLENKKPEDDPNGFAAFK